MDFLVNGLDIQGIHTTNQKGYIQPKKKTKKAMPISIIKEVDGQQNKTTCWQKQF